MPAFGSGSHTIQVVTDRWNNGDGNLCIGFVRKPENEDDEDQPLENEANGLEGEGIFMKCFHGGLYQDGKFKGFQPG